MFKRGRSLLSAAFLLVSISISAQNNGSRKVTIRGTIVAYDLGLQLANGRCRQTLIVQTKRPINGEEYIIVRYEGFCAEVIPEQKLESAQYWRFALTRDADCDQRLDDLLYITSMSPTGKKLQYPRLRLMPGTESERIPSDKKLPCHIVRPSDFEASPTKR